MPTICDKCGKELSVGEWPWCAHGFGNNLQKPMEPYTDEMIGSTPVEFRTIGEKVRYMDRHEITERRERGRSSHPDPLPSSAVRNAIRDSIHELRR